jgi:BirA family biotin operon repressor/biotin-[acetyl-CoA-carboxylase] ligase
MTTDRVLESRRPLSEAELIRAVVRAGGLWRQVEVARRTGSTNADVAARARGGAAEGLVLAAEEQASGRGRMGRSWVSPPGASLTFSVLLRPDGVPPARRGWLPLIAGVAAASAVRDTSGADARLKWPNDVLISGRKLAGILAEQHGGEVVVGIGINVSASAAELPAPGPASLPATSLLRVLERLERQYLAWRADPGAGRVRDAYRALCSTLGREVRVELPGGQLLSGSALDVDSDGRLLVRPSAAGRCAEVSPAGADGLVGVAAGDVVHVR